MARASWEALESSRDYQNIKPIYSVDYKDAPTLLKWTREAFDVVMKDRQDAIMRARENIARYKGIYPSVEPVIGGRDLPARYRRFPRLIVNHYKDLIEQKVTMVTRQKSATSVIPPNTDTDDRIDAEIAEDVLSSVKYENDLDGFYSRLVRLALLTGTSFLYTHWNPWKGDLHPDWKKLKQEGKKAPLLGKDGEEVTDVNGKPVMIETPIYQGDVDFRIRTVLDTFLLPATRPEDCEGVILLDYEPIEKLREMYDDLGEITSDERAVFLDPNTLVERKLENYALVFTVYIRSNRFIEEGLYFRCTREKILEVPRPNPISYIPRAEFGNLPIRWLRDIEVEDELYGYPSASDIAPVQNIYDKIVTLCVKNIFWAAHTKWFATQGSVDRAELGNDSTIVWVKPGMEKPVAQSFPAFTGDVFQFLGYVVSVMEQTFGIFSISRGAPPPGSRSASALYFYDEQQQMRSSGLVKKLNKLVVEEDRLILSLIADNYTDKDERLIKIVGATKEWLVKRFEVESLRKSYDIRLEISPNLPDSRYARIELLLQMKERAPQSISDETLADVLDFGNTDKYITPTRVARIGADSENDSFRKGKAVADPEKWQDHITHWQEHLKAMQSPDFLDWPEKRREALMLHVKTHERLMDEIAQTSPAMAQTLMGIPQFPVFFKPPPIPQPPPGMMPPQQNGGPPKPPGQGTPPAPNQTAMPQSQGMPANLLPQQPPG